MINIYEKLFNLTLDSGHFPSSWVTGIIKPIYKNKGNKSDPQNFRPITLVTCFSKLFTSISNNRLNSYVTENDILKRNQAGFRKGFSTVENIFIMDSLISILNSCSRNVYCAFVDFKSAFDTVWRADLWAKLIKSNINGKVFRVIKNMYTNIKSCVSLNNKLSDFFISNMGVRQGENLSPFLFSIFMNDLEDYLEQHRLSGIICETQDAEDIAVTYFKLFILLYADDTVIISETSDGLQEALNTFESYCNDFKLSVNISKTKIVIFSKGKQNKNLLFRFNNSIIEIVSEYKYLGIIMSRNGSYVKSLKHTAEQATRAMYGLFSKIRHLPLPADVIVDLYEKTIKPILLYGCEIWGFGKIRNS